MRTEQRVFEDGSWRGPTASLSDAQVVFVFGSRHALEGPGWQGPIRDAYPNAVPFGCSTSGEIAGTEVLDESVVATAVHFEKTRIATHHIALADVGSSQEVGAAAAKALDHEGLRHVFVLSDGQSVNGSELTRGLTDNLPEGVAVTGGLAGDGARFERTHVVCGEVLDGSVAVMGLYGEELSVGFGSLGGWDTFGPQRQVTRSEGNVLFELDGKPALELYKTYLGEHADGLPATGLLFPLEIRRSEESDALVRTILAVDEEAQSMTFAGDVPEGALAHLMKANFDRLVEGAEGAAQRSAISGGKAELALLISCVGRKLVLKQRTEDEVEGVAEVLGDTAMLTGFYSYGEICPASPGADCQLHNQTMTITTFREG
jgi:hypothetical protein